MFAGGRERGTSEKVRVSRMAFKRNKGPKEGGERKEKKGESQKKRRDGEIRRVC